MLLFKLTKDDIKIKNKDLPDVLHFEIREFSNFYDLNLVMSTDVLEIREDLEYYSRNLIEHKGYSKPADLYLSYNEDIKPELITIYNYNFAPLLNYLDKFDCWQLRAYYVKNNLVRGAFEDLKNIILNEYEDSDDQSFFNPLTNFLRILRSLEDQWH